MKRKQATTRQVMDAALSIFAEKDVSKVTMRAIAKTVGIGAASIYRFFPSKEELLFAIATEQLAEMTVGLREHLQGIVGGLNKLRKCTWFILYFFEFHPQFASLLLVTNPLRIWGTPPGDSPVGDQARILAEIIKEGQLAGEVNADIDIKHLRDLYFGGLQRLTYLWLVRGMTYRLTDAADQFTKLVFEGIRKQPEESPPFRCPFVEELERFRQVRDVDG